MPNLFIWERWTVNGSTGLLAANEHDRVIVFINLNIMEGTADVGWTAGIFEHLDKVIARLRRAFKELKLECDLLPRLVGNWFIEMTAATHHHHLHHVAASHVLLLVALGTFRVSEDIVHLNLSALIVCGLPWW